MRKRKNRLVPERFKSGQRAARFRMRALEVSVKDRQPRRPKARQLALCIRQHPRQLGEAAPDDVLVPQV